MYVSVRRLVKIVLYAVLTLQSVTTYADISTDESPSYDGSFNIIIDPSVWEPFLRYDGPTTLNFSEYYRLPGGDTWSFLRSYTDLSNTVTQYPIQNKEPGEYRYELEVAGQTGDRSGNSWTYETEVTVLLTPEEEPSIKIELDDYDVYYGDFNDDGVDGDIYFHQRDLFVLIAGDISIPLLLEQEIGFVVHRSANYDGYIAPRALRLTKDELESYQKLIVNNDYFKGDINGDGDLDYFIRGAEAGLPSLAVLQTDVGYPEFVSPSISELRFDPSDRNNTIRLVDYNLDGRADLVLLSSTDGYALDVIYAKNGGKLDDSYYTVSTLDEVFTFNTYPVSVTGTLGGQFHVGETGAATYSIPVFTPEGTAGVTPSVGMSYSSQAGGGIMGKGWSLNAYSGISRCRQTLDQDKKGTAITWTSADRFCLDGQRLVLDGSLEYGAVNSTYRTEIDSQVLVTLHGNISGEPDYFSAIKKDGSITYYGLTSGLGASTKSKQSFTAGKTMSWNQAITQDNAGNPIKYFYKHKNGLDFRLDRIEYAYAAAGISNTSANTRIRFDYEQRPDVINGWLAGQKSEQNYRLKRIDVENTVNSNVVVRNYHMFYNREMVGNANTKRSFIGAIQECVRSSCKKATRFNWDLVSGEIDSSEDDSFKISSNSRPLMSFKRADFNGDGVMDVVWLHSYVDQDFIGDSVDTPLEYAISVNGKLTKALFANGEPLLQYPESGASGEQVRIQPIDYNVDGRSDLAVYRDRGPNSDTWTIYLSVPTLIDGQTDWRLTNVPIPTGIGGLNANFADINSDGLVDLIDGEKVYLLEPRFQSPTELEYESDNFYKFSSPIIMSWDPGSYDLTDCLDDNEKSDFESGNIDVPMNYRTKVEEVLDFNGDGLMDVLGKYEMHLWIDDRDNPNDGQARVCSRTFLLKQQDGAFSNELTLAAAVKERHIIDANADGLSDLLVVKSNGDVEIFISDGLSLGSKETRTIQMNAESTVQVLDYNRDGFADIVEFRHNDDGLTLEYRPKVHLWNINTKAYDTIVYENPTVKGESIGFYMDVNGDGLSDFVRYQDKYLDTYLYEADGEKFEAVSSIASGEGAVTNIHYQPMNISDHYSGLDIKPELSGTAPCYRSFKSAPCNNYALYSASDFYHALNKGIEPSNSKLNTGTPVLEMNGPFHIVTRVTNNSPSSNLDNDPLTPDGISGTGNVTANSIAAVSYYYNEAKIQAGGRGFLGFHKLTTEDEQSGILTSTIYRQDFPLTGSPLSTFVYAPNDAGLLSESHNVYNLLGWLDNAEAIAKKVGTAALGPIRPYVSEVVDVSYSTKSSVDSGGAIELLQADETNIGGCVDQGPGCHPYLNHTTTQHISHKVTTLSKIDAYGNNLSTVVETTGEGLSQRVESTNTYGEASDNIVLHGRTFSYAELGRITQTTVQKTKNGIVEPSQRSVVSYYNADSEDGYAGMLKTEKIVPELGADDTPILNEVLETSYKYNSLGMLKTKTTTGWDGYATTSRTASTTYDATGRFIEYSSNALGYIPSRVLSRNEYGAATLTEDINGAQVTKQYDAWGRATFTSSNIGGSASTSYVSCPYSGIECPNYAKTAIIQRTSAANNAITSVAFYDLMGREIRAGALSFDGSMVYTDTEYDVTGRVVRKSSPYFASHIDTTYKWTRNYYDVLGRTLSAYLPDGSGGKFEYDGYSHKTINDVGHVKTKIKNGLGELVEVIDELGGRITYSYTTDGELRSTTGHKRGETAYAYGNIAGLCQQPTSNLQTVLCYDRLGRKTAMWDPDKGYWTYEHNAFGELVKQTNANGHYVQTKFDILGRSIERWDHKQGGALEGYTSWHYDDQDDQGQAVADAKLQLTAVAYSEGRVHEAYEATNGVGSADLITRSIYDTYGRIKTTTKVLPDGNIYDTWIENYDGEGRIGKEHNALSGVISRDGERFASGIARHYNDYGFLKNITNLEDDQNIYEATAFDERGNVKTATLGHNQVLITNGYDEATGLLVSKGAVSGLIYQHLTYDWDTVGNLSLRTHQNSSLAANTSLIEEFCYDRLNRLIKNYHTTNTTGALSEPTCPTNESAFDVTYDQLGNIKSKAGVGDYHYGAVGSNGHRAGPHALTSVLYGSKTTSYGYDNNGNLVSDGSRSFVYSTYDKPTSMSKGSHTTKFKYGASRSRYYREDTSTNGTQKTWYLGNIEKIELTNGSIEWRRTLDGGVVHTYTTNQNNVETALLKKRYILRDHLGSSSLILEESGATIGVVQAMSFDAWGQRRNAQTMSSFSELQLLNFDHSITTKGYTGHEMVDEIGVVHMNGRIYDARLGRFLQADPHVQAPTDLQSYNRYAYVRNNPLNATDPSGYFWAHLAVGIIAGMTAQQFGEATGTPWLSGLGSLACAGAGPGAIACAGGAGFGATYGATGSFGKALESGLISAGSAWAFSKIGEGAFDKSMLNDPQAHGFAGPPKPGLVNFAGLRLTPGEVVGVVAKHALVGGVVSDLQGGKFAHGFVSAGLTKGIMGGMGMERGDEYSRTFVASMVGGTTSKVSGGKFANGAITAAMGHWFNAEGKGAQKGRQGVIDAYEKLYSTLEQRVADNPEGVIALTTDESELLFKGHFYKTLQQERRDSFSGNYDEKHIMGHFSGGVADTILRGLSHRQFSIYGEVAWGGHINYIGVGMLAAHYGPNAYQSIPGIVTAHNVGQVFGSFGGGGLRNLRDIGSGTKWALRGADYYNANSR